MLIIELSHSFQIGFGRPFCLNYTGGAPTRKQNNTSQCIFTYVVVSRVKPNIHMCSKRHMPYFLNSQFSNSTVLSSQFSVVLFWQFCLERIFGDKCFEMFSTVASLFRCFWSKCLKFKSNLTSFLFPFEILASVFCAPTRTFPLRRLSPLNWNLSDCQSYIALS